jgi:hypothetical protein
MTTETPTSVADFHRELANELFNHVLNLIARSDRSCAENDQMIHAAHACRFHWDFGGNPANIALGEWLCARAHTEMRQPDAALHCAWRYLEHAESYGLGPFHIAYAHTALARAFALKDPAESARHFQQARELAEHVKEQQERDLLNHELAVEGSATAGSPPTTA